MSFLKKDPVQLYQQANISYKKNSVKKPIITK